MKEFIISVCAILFLALYVGVCAMLINLSTCPAIGWYLLVVLIATIVGMGAWFIHDVIRENKAIAAMGKPYEPSDAKANELANQKSNTVTIAQ